MVRALIRGRALVALAAFAGLLLASSPTAAQSPAKVPRVGVISSLAPPPAPNPELDAFRQGLRELGYVEGQTVALELRWSGDGRIAGRSSSPS